MNYTTTSRDTQNLPGASTFSAFITEHLRDIRRLAAGTRKGRLRGKR